MWIFTQDGFYSVTQGVKHPNLFEAEPEGFSLEREEYLLVRTRDSESMENAKLRFTLAGIEWPEGEWTGTIWDHAGSDYEHRMLMPRYLWAKLLEWHGTNLTYPSFKSYLSEVWVEEYGTLVGRQRATALLEIWCTIKDYWPTDEWHWRHGSSLR
tara:strand:- start:176 stop:640 length:465 start_codon:yes stop_codon:yes gene_type:complete